MFRYRAKIIRVVDGDTVVAWVDLGFSTYVKQTLRLFGIDAPEMRGKDKLEGRKATSHLGMLISAHEPTIVQTVRDKTGKYGRYLATLLGGEGLVDINQRMVDDGHAVKYSPRGRRK